MCCAPLGQEFGGVHGLILADELGFSCASLVDRLSLDVFDHVEQLTVNSLTHGKRPTISNVLKLHHLLRSAISSNMTIGTNLP